MWDSLLKKPLIASAPSFPLSPVLSVYIATVSDRLVPPGSEVVVAVILQVSSKSATFNVKFVSTAISSSVPSSAMLVARAAGSVVIAIGVLILEPITLKVIL